VVPVRLELPNGYPRHEPRAYDIANRFVHDADGHFYPDSSRCCLWLDVESQWDPRDQKILLNYVDQVALFFQRQLIFEATGRKTWPGPARGHGILGYQEYAREQLGVSPDVMAELWPAFTDFDAFPRYQPCPCGGGRAFKWCHQPEIQRLRSRIGTQRLRRWHRDIADDEKPTPREELNA
jgi:hypothetical protein